VRGSVGYYHYHNDDREKDLTFQQPYYGVYNANGNVTGIKNKAVFGSLTVDITPALTASLEVRNAKEEKKRIEFASAASPNANLNNGTALTPIKASYSKTTPRLTVDWKVRDGLMVYAVASKGAKPGGINGSAGVSIGKGTYTMETSNNFELGIKSSWLDNRLRANLAVYHTKAKDVQVTQALPAASGGTAVTSIAVNQGGAKIKGLEADIQAVLGAGFSAQYTFSFTDSKFTSGCDDFQYVLMSGGYAYPAALASDPTVQAQCSIAGHRLPLVPKIQSSLSLTYDRAINDSWSFVGSTTGTYESSKFVQVHNLAETGTTTEIGLRLGLRSEYHCLRQEPDG
jgi:outer membrane receptor protein involved in Fe transport